TPRAPRRGDVRNRVREYSPVLPLSIRNRLAATPSRSPEPVPPVVLPPAGGSRRAQREVPLRRGPESRPLLSPDRVIVVCVSGAGIGARRPDPFSGRLGPHGS